MAGLSNEDRLTVRTASEVVEGVKLAVLRFERTALRFRAGRTRRALKLKIEAIVGAVLLDFVRKSPQEQDALIARRLPQLQALVLGEPEPAESPPDPAVPYVRSHGRFVGTVPPTKPPADEEVSGGTPPASAGRNRRRSRGR